MKTKTFRQWLQYLRIKALEKSLIKAIDDIYLLK